MKRRGRTPFPNYFDVKVSKTRRNLRRGKDRFTYLKIFKRYVIEIHIKYDEVHGTIWGINAFKVPR